MNTMTLYLPSGKLEVDLNESQTAKAVYQGGPYQALAQLYGDELYFSTSIRLESEESVSVVSAGDVAYWPPGQALCFFFGATPDSNEDEIRPASPVNLIGSFKVDFELLRKVHQGDIVSLQF